MEVFTPMCCDIIHIGHINILKIAATYGKFTIGLMSDNAMKKYKRTPIFTYNDREQILREFKNVYNIIILEGPEMYKNIVIKYKPKIFIHGDDWKSGPQKKARDEIIEEMLKYGGKVIEPEYTLNISTTSIINSLFDYNITKSQKKYIGLKLRTLFNTLKRPIPVLARELNISNDIINNCIEGSAESSILYNLILKIYDKYPISYCNIWSEDKNNIISLNTIEMFDKSERITYRNDKNNQLSEYYLYKDLAMNKLSPIVPEWIKMLRYVNNNNPNNKDICMNNGHFMWQMTYFIGSVNFYYELNGERHVHIANTGDTNIISQYVPHSFTTRNLESNAHIIAVTFEGNVQRTNNS